MQNLLKVVCVQKTITYPWKLELSILRIIGIKIVLWTYSEMISYSSLLRSWCFPGLPNCAAQEVPRYLSYQTSNIFVSQGSPRATPQGDPLTLFILRVSNCIQMEDIMTSATRTEYRDREKILCKNKILILLETQSAFSKVENYSWKEPEIVDLVLFSHLSPQICVSFKGHNPSETQRLLLWDKKTTFFSFAT